MRRAAVIASLILIVLLATAAFVALNGLVLVVLRNQGPSQVTGSLFVDEKEVSSARSIPSGGSTIFMFVPRVEGGMKFHCTAERTALFDLGYVTPLMVVVSKIVIASCLRVQSHKDYLV